MFGLNLPKGQLALEWTVPAPSAPAFPAPSSGSSLQNSQQLPHGACIKIIEALEWLGKAKESCNYYCIYVFHHFFHPFFFHQIMPFFSVHSFRGKKALMNDASGSAALQLKSSLRAKLTDLLDKQRQLDEIRLTMTHNGMSTVKDLLASTAKSLCETQEVVRALQAMA